MYTEYLRRTAIVFSGGIGPAQLNVKLRGRVAPGFVQHSLPSGGLSRDKTHLINMGIHGRRVDTSFEDGHWQR